MKESEDASDELVKDEMQELMPPTIPAIITYVKPNSINDTKQLVTESIDSSELFVFKYN